MTLYSQHFQRHVDLAKFVNDSGIAKENILKIDADSASGGWVLWWYA